MHFSIHSLDIAVDSDLPDVPLLPQVLPTWSQLLMGGQRASSPENHLPRAGQSSPGTWHVSGCVDTGWHVAGDTWYPCVWGDQNWGDEDQSVQQTPHCLQDRCSWHWNWNPNTRNHFLFREGSELHPAVPRISCWNYSRRLHTGDTSATLRAIIFIVLQPIIRRLQMQGRATILLWSDCGVFPFIVWLCLWWQYGVREDSDVHWASIWSDFAKMCSQANHR